MKIQNLDRPNQIYNDYGSGHKIVKNYTLSELLNSENIIVPVKYFYHKPELRVINIYPQKKDFYGITYKFFNKLIKRYKQTF